MALCTTTRVIYGCTNATGTTCTKTPALTIFEPSAVPASSCAGSVVMSATEYTAVLDAQSNFGWDQTAFDAAVTGGFTFFAVGLGIGLIVQAIRRARSP